MCPPTQIFEFQPDLVTSLTGNACISCPFTQFFTWGRPSQAISVILKRSFAFCSHTHRASEKDYNIHTVLKLVYDVEKSYQKKSVKELSMQCEMTKFVVANDIKNKSIRNYCNIIRILHQMSLISFYRLSLPFLFVA